jgi:serine/threonine-protein kinase
MTQMNHPSPHAAATSPEAALGALAPRDWLGSSPYRIVRELGRGGMGAVFEAEHLELQKRVVVKVLHPQYAKEPRIVERLQREARSLARLASPYVVAVSDMGRTADGATYLVMECLVGRTLRQELQALGVLPVQQAIVWTQQVLAGLSAAHRIGIVHRDIKLDNLFLCDATEDEPRRIKLLDFGIAKVLEHPGKRPEPMGNQPTQEGTILGSPRWLAPEQARGKTVDARADIYAVGVLLYTLIVGRGPFAHLLDAFELIQAHISETPVAPSLSARQYIPPELDDAILMALSKQPEDRFQTAQAFSQALSSIAQRLGEVTQPLVGTTPLPTSRREFVGEGSAAQVNQQEHAAVERTPGTRAGTLVLKPEPPSRESAAPTLVQSPAVAPDAAISMAPSANSGVAPAIATIVPSRTRAAIFVGLVTASTVVFFVLLASIAHLLGGR